MTSGTTSDALTGRRVLVGVSGGIAAYKVASVVSGLAQRGVETTVLMTDAATRFVGPLTFQALSGRPVYTDQWEHVEAHDPQHIALARGADAMLIAPASMNLISKLAHGRTDDVVSLVVSGIDLARQPVLVAPSMNEVMYNQPSNRRNLDRLAEDGFRIIDPASGWQACRTSGIGRLPEPDALLEAVLQVLRAAP